MRVIGIDLSGPANHKDTVMMVFQLKNQRLIFEEMIKDASDDMIISAIDSPSLDEDTIIGMDAPLSYQDGGGDRLQDKSIRQYIKSIGLSGSSIMPPTLTKMVYLTLRGMGLTRRLMAMNPQNKIRLIEVHPGAAIGSRIGAQEIHHALNYKREAESRQVIFEWFQTVGMVGLPEELPLVTHQIDACAAALAAWHWADPTKQPMWHWSATTPKHPFEFCC